MTVGQRLKLERARLGLSQEAFGALGGVAANAQGNYEADKRSPDATYLSGIAERGVDVQYVLTGNRSMAAQGIDTTLFGLCEAALRAAYREAQPDAPTQLALRPSQICKVYNAVISKLKPDDDVGRVASTAADMLIEISRDPADSTQLARVLLYPAGEQEIRGDHRRGGISGAASARVTQKNVTASGAGAIAAGKGVHHHHHGEPRKRPKK